MKNARQILVLIAIAIITLVATVGNAAEGVSPGAGDRLAEIRDGCPTFSWGEVEGAVFYEVVAYRLPKSEGFVVSAGIELSKENEVLYTRVAGAATAWTPSLERCFSSGGSYVWFVRAVFDENATSAASEWSQGLFFSVAAAPSAEEVRQALGVLQRYLEEGDGGSEQLAALFSNAAANADKDAARRSGGAGSSKLAGRALPGTAAIRGEQVDPTGETYGVYGITSSSTDGSLGVVGEATAATGEVFGVGGITASADGAGVIAFNTSNGTDLILGADTSSAHLTELGITRSVPGPATFDIDNPDGAGAMTLRVDGIDVVTTLTDQDSLGGLNCAGGEVAKWNGSQWACASDDGTAYVAGNQLELDGTTLNVLEGDGSDLDADTLDSHEADYFATEVHDHFDQTWIGTGSHGLRAENSTSSGFGLIGWGTSPSGVSYGVFGKSTSPSGYGVWGWASAATGETYGVSGLTNSNSGRGVHGEAISATGVTSGVYGVSDSTSGHGVWGEATATSGVGKGVYGRTEASEGYGVSGYVVSTTGVNYGVNGRTDSADGYGGYFNNEGGGLDIMAGGSGDVAQTREGNGLVKAAAFVICSDTLAVVQRSFSNAPGGGPVSITWNATGTCTIDFGFDVSDRYWSAVSTNSFTNLGCLSVSPGSSELLCWGTSTVGGAAEEYAAMILVY